LIWKILHAGEPAVDGGVDEIGLAQVAAAVDGEAGFHVGVV
jgi:hypothetical protein